MDAPLLSVCLITYNHATYIRQAIEGVLMQQINFSWELIIADDYSTDGTREIVFEYHEKYPELIKIIPRSENVGAAKNWIELISFSRAKYIAYFEGDDYWTDPSKLQKQVDFLESNPSYGICWTKATYHDILTNKKYVPESFEQLLENETYYTIDLNSYYDKYATPTLTTVFKANILSLYNIKKFSYFNDSALFLTALSQCNGALLNFNSATYRIHTSGLWNGVNNYTKKLNIFYALDSAMAKIPQLSSFDHLVIWRKWNLTQAYYLLAESFSIKDFKQLTFLLIKILKYQDWVEKRKALKIYLKTLYSAR